MKFIDYVPSNVPGVPGKENEPGTKKYSGRNANVPNVPSVPGNNIDIYIDEGLHRDHDSANALYVSTLQNTGNTGNTGNIGEFSGVNSCSRFENLFPEPGTLATKPGTLDLTDFIGHIVDEAEWLALQGECSRRHGDRWKLFAKPINEGYRITGMSAK